MGQLWENETEDAIYFWGGILSNWAKFQFIVQLRNDPSMQFYSFNCVEQYMMASKAYLFNDNNALEKILNESDPRKQKALGRQVANYVDEEWRSVARDVVYTAVYAKFDQNSSIRTELLNTGDKILVEASATDTVWGIGLAPFDHDVANITKWRGTNWLGQVLMQVRGDLRTGKNQSHQAIDWDFKTA